MPRYRLLRDGKEIKIVGRGFPCFYTKRRLQRVITKDIWSFLYHICETKLTKASLKKAKCYIDQAYDYYIAASNPRHSSRPVLYYYALLNLAKICTLYKGTDLPLKVGHGIFEPASNNKFRYRLDRQEIGYKSRARDHSEIFPELINCFPLLAPRQRNRKITVMELLSQIPTVHRTYTRVTKSKASFCPIEYIEVLRKNHKLWIQLGFSKSDLDVQTTIRDVELNNEFRKLFYRVSVPRSKNTDSTGNKHHNAIIYESKQLSYSARYLDNALGKLAERFRNCGVWTIFTNTGYSYYLYSNPETNVMPQICSSYALMFYLGSITRYRPYDYSKLVDRFSWVINDFLETQPSQILYIMASYLAETEVVSPPIPPL